MTDKFIIMGVAGCGKTSVGEAMAAQFNWIFVDGDALHPASNITKMSKGIPLDDSDRQPWLVMIGKRLKETPGNAIIGCSALKRSYRDIIREAAGSDVCFVFLNGSRELIESRMAVRKGHFMPLSLLDSQFDALEPPMKDETFIDIDINGNLPSILDRITQSLTPGMS